MEHLHRAKKFRTYDDFTLLEGLYIWLFQVTSYMWIVVISSLTKGVYVTIIKLVKPLWEVVKIGVTKFGGKFLIRNWRIKQKSWTLVLKDTTTLSMTYLKVKGWSKYSNLTSNASFITSRSFGGCLQMSSIARFNITT